MAFVAIDGGGTRCRLAFCDGARRVVVEGGSANVSSDFEGALATIRDGLGRLAADAGVAADGIAALPAFVGLAGVTGPDLARRVRAGLRFSSMRVEDDRPAALCGALGARDGVVAHCGTGSFLAARISGTMRFSGGWGSVLGDEASAFWVGRQALSLTLRSVDGRCAATPLTLQFLADLGGAAGIVDLSRTASPREIGALAPRVTEQAQNGDAVALRILRDGAAEIAASARHLGWVPGLALCLTGGIGPHYAPYLPGDMRQALIRPQGDPLDGAIALARALAEGGDPDAPFQDRGGPL